MLCSLFVALPLSLTCEQKQLTDTLLCSQVHTVFFTPSCCRILPAMVQWTVEDIVQEVKHLETIGTMRKESKFMETMVKCLVSKLQAIDTVPPSAYVKLMGCFSECSLPEEITEQLADALEEKSVETTEGHLRLQACPQSMTNVFNYLSKTEWEKIQNLTFAEACSVLVCRLRTVGLKSMKEKTKNMPQPSWSTSRRSRGTSCPQLVNSTSWQRMSEAPSKLQSKHLQWVATTSTLWPLKSLDRTLRG